MSGWHAELEVRVEASPRGSRVARLRHRGPLRVQRPFLPEGPARPHVYLLHPPGGLVSRDRLDIRVSTGEGSAVLLTAPGATKAYRSSGPSAWQQVLLDMAPESTLEWLPHEVIAFDGARLDSRQQVRLASSSRYFGWEVLCLGRPASGKPFRSGHVDLRQEILVDGRSRLRERVLWNDDTLRWWDSPAAQRGCSHMATVVAWPGTAGLAAAAREVPVPAAMASSGGLVEGLYVHRILCCGLPALRAHLVALWRAVRPLLVGVVACPPRIWST